MAEVTYGQSSRAEEILEEIKNTAEKEHDALTQLLTSQEMLTTLSIENTLKDEEGSKYERQQQGQEIEYSRLQQYIQEKELKELLRPGSKGGISSDEASETANSYLKDVKEKVAESLKAQFKQMKDQATQYLEGKARFSNFSGALKNDLNLFTGKLQLLTQLPGVTTLLSGIKMILAQLALLFVKAFPRLFQPIVFLLNKLRGKKEGDEGFIEMPAAKKKREAEEKKEEFMKSEPIKGSKDFKKRHEAWIKEKADIEKAEKASHGFWGDTKSVFGRMGKSLKDTYNNIKDVGKTFGTWVKKIFYGPLGLGTFLKRTATLVKDTWSKTILPAVKGFFTKTGLKNAINFMTKQFVNAAKAIWKMVKRFALAIGNFFIQVYLFIAEIVVAIAAFIAANIAIIAVIGVLLIIAYFMWKNWDKITKWWNNMKASWNYAVDKMKLWWQSVKNMISDIGEDIAYAVKWLLKKIQLAVWKMANWVIDQVNTRLPDWAPKLTKFDTSDLEGEVSGIGKERALQQSGRSERDAALDASREGLMYAEINRQLTLMLEGKPSVGTGAPVITSIHNETTSRTHYTGYAGARDAFMKSMNTSNR